MPRRTAIQKPKNGVVIAKDTAPGSAPAPPDKSIFPITDSGRPQAKETHQGFLNEQDLDKIAMRQHSAHALHAGPSNAPGTLGSIPPFGGEQQTWQAPPYQPGAVANGNADSPDSGKAERDAMEKSSLVYVRNVSSPQTGSQKNRTLIESPQEIGLGLGTGSRLRARLESSKSLIVYDISSWTCKPNSGLIPPSRPDNFGPANDSGVNGKDADHDCYYAQQTPSRRAELGLN